MSVITASDFIEWKAHPVTKAFFQACYERVEEAKENLSVSAGLNPQEDNMLRGFIRAYREIQEFHILDLEGTEID